jgi:hypothetical protein
MVPRQIAEAWGAEEGKRSEGWRQTKRPKSRTRQAHLTSLAGPMDMQNPRAHRAAGRYSIIHCGDFGRL